MQIIHCQLMRPRLNITQELLKSTIFLFFIIKIILLENYF